MPKGDMMALVFDLGGTHLRSAVMTSRGTLVNTRKVRISSAINGRSPAEIWTDVRSRLFSYVRENLEETSPGSPIIVSVPGPVNERGRLLQAPTLAGDESVIPDFRGELEKEFRRPVYFLNDLSAAAWYISTLIPGRFLVVTVSSGIGSKLFDPAIGVLDEIPFAGEIGHTMADFSPSAAICDCGGRGHLGAIASGRGIERMAREKARLAPHPFSLSECARRYHATRDTLNNEQHIVPAFLGGDPWATDIVSQCSRYLARSLVYSIVSAGLQRVVIIGGFALAAGHHYLDLLRAAARECGDYDLLREGLSERLVLGADNEEACLLGASVYAKRVSTA
jgi:predicted NBD/HSP70 family sugar kinase